MATLRLSSGRVRSVASGILTALLAVSLLSAATPAGATGTFARTDSGSISGTVSLASGAPSDWLETVLVEAQPVAEGTYATGYVDAATGSYVLDSLEPGTYRLQFLGQETWTDSGLIVPNLVAEYYDDTTDWASAQLITLADDTVTGIDAELAVGRSISGKVSLPAGADPSWSDALRVSAQATTGSSFGYAAADPDTGEYTVTGLAPGTYHVQFSGIETWTETGSVTPNLVPEYYDDALFHADATPVDVTAGDAERIDAELAIGRSISGTVRLSEDVPTSWLGNVHVDASSFDGSGGWGTASVDPETGTYRISGLPPTPHRVQFSAWPLWTDTESTTPNLVSEYFSSTFDWSAATPVDLADGDAHGIDADLTEGRTISGTVMIPDDVDPEWISAVSVSALGIQGGSGSSSIDPATGEYAISRLAPGEYRVHFQVNSYCPSPGDLCPNLVPEYFDDAPSWSAAAIVDVTSEDRPGVDAALAEGTTISGTITLPSDAPSEWKRAVTAWPIAKDGSSVDGAHTTVNPTTGAYTISRLPVGEYHVRFSGDGYLNADGVHTNLASEFYDDAQSILDATVVNTGNGNATGIDAELGYGGRFSGIVDLTALRAHYEGTVPNVSVWVTDHTGTTQFFGVGDPLSYDELPFTASNLAPGRYRVTVETSIWNEDELTSIPQSAQILRINGSTGVDIEAGDDLSSLRLVAQRPTATISGTLTSEGLAPEPIDGIVGSALYYEHLDGGWVRLPGVRFDTDRDGATPFTIAMVPGTYTVGFENDFATADLPYAEQWWRNKGTLALADPITLTTGEIRSGVDGVLRPVSEPEPEPEPEQPTEDVDRFAGNSRFGTATDISANTFAPNVPVAYIANGYNFPDALAGAAAAGTEGGPVLLTRADRIPDNVAAELLRLKPQRIVVLGGPVAIHDSVKNALTAYLDPSGTG